jgi:hypothetical protein
MTERRCNERRQRQLEIREAMAERRDNYRLKILYSGRRGRQIKEKRGNDRKKRQ